MATSVYRRLTGKDRTLTGHSQLWLGPGHILLVKSTRFVEEYQRFSLADIQAIVITGSRERMVMNVAYIAIVALLGFTASAVTSVFGKWFFAIAAAIGLALLQQAIELFRLPRHGLPPVLGERR